MELTRDNVELYNQAANALNEAIDAFPDMVKLTPSGNVYKRDHVQFRKNISAVSHYTGRSVILLKHERRDHIHYTIESRMGVYELVNKDTLVSHVRIMRETGDVVVSPSNTMLSYEDLMEVKKCCDELTRKMRAIDQSLAVLTSDLPHVFDH